MSKDKKITTHKNHTRKNLHRKQKAVVIDIDRTTECLQEEEYINTIKFLKGEIEELKQHLKFETEQNELKQRQLNYLYHFFDTDVSIFEHTNLI